MTDPTPAPAVVIKSRPAPRPPYIPALGPVLRVLLWTIFAGSAVLGATGFYLLAITVLNRLDPGHLYTTPFTFWTIIGHTVIGGIGLLPFVLFGLWHLLTAYRRPNRLAVRLGLLVFGLGLVIGFTGLALVQLDGLPQLPTGSVSRNVVYFLHILLPVAAVFAYVGHRKAGPRIKWEYGKWLAAGTVLATAGVAGMHFIDPRAIGKEGPKDGVQYFFPSEMRTADGKFISEKALMMDEYCMKCHQDIYKDHLHSAHKFSSFNNPAYLFSVKETRKVSMERDGNMKASRWCAGCHDIVPFASGKFDDPNYDIVNDPTAHAGITCVVCHSITHVSAPIGNAAYTIEEAQHYPFAFSDDTKLQWLNNQLIKAKPEFHKKTFLKPVHKSAEFCSTCHKVHLPVELNHYKDFLRGQNHYDSFVLSGMGHGARSFYFPPTGKKDNCASCHMELKPSGDFGSKDFDGTGVRKRHDHFFPGSNTGLPVLLKEEDRYKGRAAELDQWVKKEADFLTGTDPEGKDKTLRIDLFAVKKFNGGEVDDASLAVLRPQLPPLERGKTYLFEVVVRTLNIGHHFSQGTVDSNEIWVDFEAKSGGKAFARNGGLSGPNDTGTVDLWAHFINVHMLDRNGNRIDRRNPQDIFTPLYDKQIPPGAGQVVHYKLTVPPDAAGPVELTVRLRYRKFDQKYMEYVAKEANKPLPVLPVVDICKDTVTLPVAGVNVAVPPQESPIKAGWQRWNDYGIGCLNEGGPGMKRGNLRQADAAFRKLTTLGVPDAVWHGHLNMARVAIEQGFFDKAAASLNAARTSDPPPPWWVLAWFTGLVGAQNAVEPAEFDAAIAEFEKIVDPASQPMHPDGKPKFDFTKDTVVLAELGKTRFKRSQIEGLPDAEKRAFLLKAVEAYERALGVDPEELDSHYGLSQCYAQLAAGAKAPPPRVPPTTAELVILATSGAGPEERAVARAAAATMMREWGRQPPDPKNPRLPTLRELVQSLRAEFRAEPDPAAKAAVALALAEAHLVSHGMYRPDELARAKTTAAYRTKHPAANAAAEAIVIYPTR